MSTHIYKETTRCLQCKTAPCESGCPINTPIKEAINLAKNNKIYEAGKMLFENNPLSVITGLICPHEDFCEGHCVLHKKNSSINIGAIEHYISDYYLNKIEIETNIDRNKKVAVVGSGPAGLTVAIILAQKGYDITIFESHEKIGGVLRFGIPEFRLPKKILDRYHNLLIKMGVKIRPNTLIGPVLAIDDLFRDGYKAIFIGTGTWKPRKLNVIGESLGHVYYAIDYLKTPDTHNLGDKVCIIGGGNVAIDSARTAIRNGAKEVTLFYRRGEEDMPSNKSDIDYARLDGVNFQYFRSPKAITDTCTVFIATEKTLDENGKEILVEKEGTEFCYDFDSVIISISQGPQKNIVNTSKEIKLNKFGLLVIDETGKTSKDGVYASGDVVTGAKTVVEAVAAAKRTALTIENYVESIIKNQE